MTSQAVAVRNGQGVTQAAPAALAIRPGQEFWTDKQRAALSVLGIKDASNGDLAVFMHYCQRTGLDPFSRQIYMIARRERQGDQYVTKQTIQVGIDGFRVIRDRAARRDGVTVDYEDTVWYEADGTQHAIWLWDHAPTACKVVAIKHTPTGDLRYPAVLRTAAYMATKDGKPVSQWKTQPDHMIEKCAEAFALRRAFPNDLGGVYLEDEMPPQQAEPVRAPVRVSAATITAEPGPAAQPEPARERPAGRGPRASKAETARVDELLRQIPLGEYADQKALMEWLLGGEYDGSRAQAQKMTGYLEAALDGAGGDPVQAASAIWAEYRAATAAQDSGAADGGEASDG